MAGESDFSDQNEGPSSPTLSGEFKPGGEVVYPGSRKKRSGVIHNLCSYQEGNIRENRRPGEPLNGVVFDIERTVAWDKEYNLLPHTYSMMISRDYPPGKGPTLEEFTVVADRLPEFTHKPSMQLYISSPEYVNPEGNLFINWNTMIGDDDKLVICIGVIQEKPIPELDKVVDEIVPHAVGVFNQLSPDRQLSQTVLEKSVAIARESDKIPPRRRDPQT